MQMMTLGQLADRVAQRSRGHHDDLVPVGEMTFDSLDILRIGSEAHPVRPAAQGQIATRLRVPVHYLQRCPADLQAANLNAWIGEERNDRLFVRFDGRAVRAIFTPRYVPADNEDVVDRLMEAGFDSDTRVRVALDDEFLSLSIPDPEQTFTLRGDDRITPGISVGNSEVGLSSLTVAAFLWRLICSNGLIAKSEVSTSYRHVSPRLLTELPKVLRSVSRDRDRERHQLRVSLDTPVDTPLSTIETFNRQFKLDPAEREAVEWGWAREAGNSMFNIINSYTRAAQQPELPAASNHRLERVGGAILGMVQ